MNTTKAALGIPLLLAVCALATLGVGLWSSNASAQIECTNRDTIGCDIDPESGRWIVRGSAPRRTYNAPQPQPVAPPVDPQKVLESLRLYESIRQREMSEAKARMLRNEQLSVGMTGTCKVNDRAGKRLLGREKPDDILASSRSFETACLARIPLPGVNPEIENSCDRAASYMVVPTKLNPLADPRKGYDFLLRSCYWGNLGACLSFRPKSDFGCVANQVPPAQPVVAAADLGNRGMCNLWAIAGQPMAPDIELQTLKFNVDGCEQQRDKGACLSAAISHATRKIPEANPRRAFHYMKEACRLGMQEACKAMSQSCSPE